MKAALLTLLLLILMSASAEASDIYLRNGMVYINVNAVNAGDALWIDMRTRIDTVKRSDILQIVNEPHGAYLEPTLEMRKGPIPIPGNPILQNKEYVNIKYLALGALGAVIAWEKFSDARDISDAITVVNNILINPDVPKLDAARTRAYMVGAAAAVVGIVFTVYALTPVSVSVTPNGISAAYHF